MKLYDSFILFGCLLRWISIVYGRDVTFNVIAFKALNVYLDVEGLKYKMVKPDLSIPLYTIILEDVSNDEDIKYHYIVDDIHEEFERKLPKSTTTTYNELYGRKITIKNIPQFGFPIRRRWLKNGERSSIFDGSYIPTVIIDDVNGSFFKSGNSTILKKVTVFLKDSIHVFQNIEAESRDLKYNNFSFKLKLDGQGLFGTKTLFFSTTETDPSLMHQLIYSDILQAIENPSAKTVPCRVYDGNGNGRGLYILQEDTTSEDFMISHFLGFINLFNKNSTNNIGSIILGSPKSDFYYTEGAKPSTLYNEFKIVKDYKKFNAIEGLHGLSKALHDLDVNDLEQLSAFNKKWFDIPIFLKSLAVQYLTGNWNSYWMLLNNYVIYSNPLEINIEKRITDEGTHTNKYIKHYFFENKPLYTFGSHINSKVNEYEEKFPSESYNTLVDRMWGIYDKDSNYRIAITKFLESGYTKGMFEEYLINIVKYIFNPVTMNHKIDTLAERLRPEMEWITKLNNLHIGENGKNFSVADFDSEIEDEHSNFNLWGLKEWIRLRSEQVANEFNFKWYHSIITKGNVKLLDYIEIQPITHEKLMKILQG
ncbi:hypothetical protein BCR36DRAFT_324002 [Piromyces finnis]|uniref:Coth-domain-containing protein n=1 Tax=Piromyces finnis TaxID=1754191 RepID=A0A1Y1VCY2_9FUNG|nr:hypothetical protein BCR36DRAFT_324002 [Piromyces finnis]|eukprot:ORX52949.1 hypothetical protein BCR36DRAFT_324002 [Piromyces finnis]